MGFILITFVAPRVASLGKYSQYVIFHPNTSLFFLFRNQTSVLFLHQNSTRPTFSFARQFSQTEALPILELEIVSKPEPEAASEAEVETTTEVAESADKEEPKREEIFAVVMIGSRRYIVFPGQFIYTQRLNGANVNDKIILNKALLVGTKTTTYIGKPVVSNASVHAVVEKQGLNPKVIVFKYKKKKNYRRNIGHRVTDSQIHRIRITGITGYQDYPAVTLDSLNSVE